MDFLIKEINRVVKLNDKIVKKYREVGEIGDPTFLIPLYLDCGKENVSNIEDEELSMICNNILLDEMKAWCLIPEALEMIKGDFTKKN